MVGLWVASVWRNACFVTPQGNFVIAGEGSMLIGRNRFIAKIYEHGLRGGKQSPEEFSWWRWTWNSTPTSGFLIVFPFWVLAIPPSSPPQSPGVLTAATHRAHAPTAATTEPAWPRPPCAPSAARQLRAGVRGRQPLHRRSAHNAERSANTSQHSQPVQPRSDACQQPFPRHTHPSTPPDTPRF